MLQIVLSPTDDFPEAVELQFEHSLVSLSKWEAKHETPFFKNDEMTHEQTLSYIEMMLIGRPPHEGWLNRLTVMQQNEIVAHINAKQTATWFREDASPKRPNTETITNELIYHWMIDFKIPFDPCENWHLNRLMTLIRVRSLKQAKPKKMSRAAQMEEMRRLNAERRQASGSAG